MSTKESKQITLSDGRKLGFAEYGNPDGKPLLEFHGWPSSRLRSPAVQKAAQEANIRLICPDRPGYGISDFQEKRTILDWPNDVTELADQLQIDQFAVAGVSGGGPYAAACAYALKDRLTEVGIVVGLAPPYVPGLLKEMTPPNRWGWKNYARFPIWAALGSYYQYLCSTYLSNYFFLSFPSEADKKAIRELKEDFLKDNREAFAQGIQGATQDLILYSQHWGFELQNIMARVYLWYGAADKNVPLAMGEYYAEQIPNSHLTVYPDEGHVIATTHAKEIFEALTK